MLTLTLRHLERDGLVGRTVFAEVPPRVEYELTPTDRTLIEPAVTLAEWAIKHNPDIGSCPSRFAERSCATCVTRTWRRLSVWCADGQASIFSAPLPPFALSTMI
jgi:hypothetical protein